MKAITLLIAVMLSVSANAENRHGWYKFDKKKIEITASETVQFTCFATTAYYLVSGVGYPNQKPITNLKRRQMILTGVACMVLTVSVSIPLKSYIRNKYKY